MIGSAELRQRLRNAEWSGRLYARPFSQFLDGPSTGRHAPTRIWDPVIIDLSAIMMLLYHKRSM